MSAPDAIRPVGAGSVLCGRYRLVKLIAQGGMASVWESYDSVLARAVAVKMLHPHLAADRMFQERFRREAVAAARLAHPNVVATFDAGITPEGTAFIVMELVRGCTLAAYEADRQPVPGPICVSVGIQIADALAHAHAAGLVHRDVKPANVLVCDPESGGIPLVKVTDFGIAKAAEGLGLSITKTGTVLGTPKYLSPEQIEGREPDARADIYALGVVLFELVAGIPPFRGPTEMAVAMQHLNDTPERLRDLRPAVPAALDALVAQMLAKQPDQRPPSAAVVRQVLADIEARGRQTGPASGIPAPAPGPTGRHAPPGTPRGVRPGIASGSRGQAGPDATPRLRVRGQPLGDEPEELFASHPRPPAYVPPSQAAPPGWPPPPPVPSATTSFGGPAGANGRTRVAPPSGAARGGGGAGGSGSTGRPYRPNAPNRGRPAPGRPPNWTGRLVAGLVVLALIVVVVVLASHGSSRGKHSPSSSQSPVTNAPMTITGASVFHLERDADDAANAGLAADGNVDTAWVTDTYFSPAFGNLRKGLGLAFTLNASHILQQLKVTSSSTGWNAEVFVADAVPSPPSLAAWGSPVDSQQNINGNTVFNLHGHRGSAVLLWITYLGPANKVAIAEAAVN